MDNHSYLALGSKDREKLLKELPGDDLLVLLKDLEQLDTTCDLLLDELLKREISTAASDSHVLPSRYFQRDSKPRRLPGKLEYLFKRGLFLWCKFSVIGAVGGGILIDTGHEALALPVIILAGIGMFAPLLFAWFNPFYRPLTYTLVRPFNADEFSKPLKRFILRNVGLRCHGVTLSDRNFSPSLLLRFHHRLRWLFATLGVLFAGALAGPAMVAAIASTWIQQSVRLATVYAPSGFVYLAHIFSRRRIMSGKHFFCGGQCFNIRTVDTAWKYAMQSCVYEADFILVDLSLVRPGSDWEIELLELRDRIQHCIPICQVGCNEVVSRYSRLFPDIIYYDKSGRITSSDDLIKRIRNLPVYNPDVDDDGGAGPHGQRPVRG